MARPIIANVRDAAGTTIPTDPVIRVPNGEDITIRSSGWDFVIKDNAIHIVNRRNNKTVFLVNNNEIVIGDANAEHIKLKQ